MSKFFIGSSTSAHQVEGNNIYSDYWAQENMKNTEFYEKSLDAVDQYHLYEEDIKLMAKANLNAYRFSIEWARIEPFKGQFIEKEILHYVDIIKTLKKYSIEPIITLHHFSSPKWLIEEGGWENKKVINYFSRYVSYVLKYIKDDVSYICTINEANMGLQIKDIAERYKKRLLNNKSNVKDGQVQVGLDLSKMLKGFIKRKFENFKVFKTLNPHTFVSMRSNDSDKIVIDCHLEAKKIIKENNPNIKVGITLSLHDIQYVEGGYDNAVKCWNNEFLHYAEYLKDDDFIGVQNYTRSVFNSNGLMDFPEGCIITQGGYEYYPNGLANVIRKVYEGIKIPVLVTENGIATDDDSLRQEFIKIVMKDLNKVLSDNIPLIGYLHWSFIDNYEWQKGFGPKFGLVSVDRKTMERTPKDSLFLLGTYNKD